MSQMHVIAVQGILQCTEFSCIRIHTEYHLQYGFEWDSQFRSQLQI